MRRRDALVLLGGAAAALPLVGRAEPTAIPKVGFLYPGSVAASNSRLASFLSGLRYAGFQAPEQVELIVRIADGEPARLAPLATELVNQKVDVIVPIGTAAVRIVQAATTTIPVVAHDLDTDPVASGLIKSLAHPGGNITGFFFAFPEFRMKWLELLKEVIPNLTHVAALWDPASGSSQVKAVEDAASALNLKLEIVEARKRDDLDAAFVMIARLAVQALLLLSSPVLAVELKSIADLALKNKLPSITILSGFAHSGGLIAYGPNLLDTYRQLGGLVGKVLNGARTADLPAELPTKFELVVNLKTAKALGMVVPTSILLRADEVIE